MANDVSMPVWQCRTCCAVNVQDTGPCRACAVERVQRDADRLRALLRRCYDADASAGAHEGYGTARVEVVDGVRRGVPVSVPCTADCLACAIERELGEVERG